MATYASKKTEDRVRDFLYEMRRDPLVKKYLHKTIWLSGSSTLVHPITIHFGDLSRENDSSIVFQWDSDKRIFDKFIDRTVKKYSDFITGGFFVSNDGSCPAEIVFKFKEAV